MTGSSKADRDQGFALFVVLAFLLIAAAAAVPFFSIARQYAFISRNVTLGVKERMLSEAILRVAAQRYSEVANGPDGVPVTITCKLSGSYPGLLISYRNHAGLIDLNAASKELLTLGFRVLGADEDAAGKLASATEAYRSVNTDGAPDDPSFAVAGGLKHAPFEGASELLDFELPKGVSAEMIESVFTVYSQSGTIDRRYSIPRLRKLIETLPQTSSSIDGSPSAAVTTEIRLDTGRDRAIRARAIYTAGLEGAPARRNGPAAVDVASGGKPIAAPDASQCGKFFDKASLSILAELTR